MRKAKYFFFGIAVLLIMGHGTPQYLYRDLDMTWHSILHANWEFIAGDTCRIIVPPDTFYFQTNEFHNWSQFMRFVDNHVNIGKEINIQHDSLKLTRRPFVTIVFDDVNETDYTLAFPVFAANTVSAVCAIIPSKVGNVNKLSWNQIGILADTGWEMASHSYNHYRLDTCSEALVIEEMERSRDTIEAHGIQCNNFVWPYNAHNSRVRALAARYFRCARAGAAGGFVYEIPQTYGLRSVNLDGICDSLTSFLNYVDDIFTQERWLIYHLHAIDSCDADSLDSLIKYIKSKPISIVTLDQAWDSIGNVIEYGDNFDDNYMFGVSHQGIPIIKDRIVAKEGELSVYTEQFDVQFELLDSVWYSIYAPNLGTVTYPFSQCFFDSVNIYNWLHTNETSHSVANNHIEWHGGTHTSSATTCYHNTNGVDDELFGQFSCPQMVVGGNVILDTVYLNIYTQAVQDSVWIYIQEVFDGVATSFDSVQFGSGAFGWDTVVVLPNDHADYTVKDKYGHRFYIDCWNDGATDIRVEYYTKIVYHLE